MNNLDKLKKFLLVNEEIKKIMVEMDYKNYHISLSKYSDLLYNKLKEIEDNFRIIKDIYPDFAIDIDNMFVFFHQKLANMHNRLEKYYQFHISDMSGKVRLMAGKYDPYNEGKDINFSYISSINELLYVMHRYILNDEKFLEGINTVDRKENNYGGEVTLCGDDNYLARSLFILGKEVYSEKTSIISLSEEEIYVLLKVANQGILCEIKKPISEKETNEYKILSWKPYLKMDYVKKEDVCEGVIKRLDDLTGSLLPDKKERKI